MLDKIVEDCMGEALYNELANILNGKTLSIQFGASTTGLSVTKENQQEYVLAGRWKAISFFTK